MSPSAPIAIIDIGSNSVRLVVYSGATRSPSVIFNEKVLAGLGRDLGRTGRIGDEAQERALAALCRFHLLVRQMGVVRTRTVATAAVRDASNGAAFLERVAEIGLRPETITGEEEARLAGKGVISGIPEADGIAGDLGGGSLELAQIGGGKVGHRASMPLGVFRLDALAADDGAKFRRKVAQVVAASGFDDGAPGRPLYLVGGSWRALARLDMVLLRHPLPITHQHKMSPKRPRELREALRRLNRSELRAIPSLSAGRIPTLPRATQLLEALVAVLRPAELVVSSLGIREGLLYDDLDRATQRLDPLVEAARQAGTGLGRFAQHGELLDKWIAPVTDDSARASRLRLAACHLADIAWAAHPEFRAERGIDMALHGNWVAIDAPGRVMLAQALFSSFGGAGPLPNGEMAALCSTEELRGASVWGHAMRLGQRLSGGVASGLERTRLHRTGQTVRLEIGEAERALLGEPVERRLKALAGAVGLKPEIVIRQ